MIESLTAWAEQGGYPAVALLMFLENVFPPIPSEVIMPIAGYAASRGDLSLPLAVLAGAFGSLAGAWLWYGIGHWLGAERLKAWAGRHGRWLTLSPRDVDRADEWFDRHGGKAVLFGRMIPAVRTLISVPAGIAGMPTVPFLIYSTVGTLVWTGALAGLGYALGDQYETVGKWLDPVSKGIVAVLLFGYLWRVVTFKPEQGRA
ncbi:MAG TPA: DedA family protein [Kiloniellaceae bacterium]